jgi:N-acetylglucosaminyl-diphospho-decaprenol L-rhamnosyltransferase
MQKLVIGIVTFNNTRDQLQHLGKSIDLAVAELAGGDVTVEVLLVDNGRETAELDMNCVQRRLSTQGNIGLAQASNRLMADAFADSRVEWFLCLDPDGALHHRCLDELLRTSLRTPEGLVEARQFPEENPKPYDPKTLDTPWASDACLLIRRGIYQQVGGYDPGFFMYMEDVDFSWRVQIAGYQVKMAPKALFAHPVLNRPYDPQVERQFLLSCRYLGHKWNDESFRLWAEQELLRHGHFAAQDQFPALPKSNFAPGGKRVKEVVDFHHLFYFSPPRW